MWLLLAFILVPLIEIALFIEVGGAIGLFPTLAVVVITAIVGSALVRSQGGQVLGRIRSSIDRLEDPSSDIADGAMILFSGALLLTPGFFTDAVGFALLIPGVRAAIRRKVAARVVSHGQSRRPPEPASGADVTIEVDYEDVTPPERRGNSGWTRS